MLEQATSMLDVCGLSVDYRRGLGRSHFRAVTNVNFTVHEGQTVGIIGESGSGKSTIANSVLGLVAPAEGVIRVQGYDVWRGRKRTAGPATTASQVVLQNPYRAFNPYRTIGWSIGEPLRSRALQRSAQAPRMRRADIEAVFAAAESVGLDPSHLSRYPSELSGGQLQRAAIARSLIARPALLILDEPTSSLDASVRGQVLNLLVTRQRELGLSYLVISHDMNIVRLLCNSIIVLKDGEVIESGETDAVLANPRSDYTRKLASAVQLEDREDQQRTDYPELFGTGGQ